MAIVGNVTIRFGSDTAGVSKGVADAKKQTKGFFDDLKSNFGRSSVLGQSLKLLAGSGAIMALGKGANELEQLTEKAKEFAIALDRGDGSARQLGAEFLKSIPVVGKLGEALANVYGIVSGEAQYVAALKEETALQENHIKVIGEVAKAFEKYHTKVTDTITDINNEIKEMQLSGLPLELFKIDVAAAKQIKDIKKEAKDAAADPSLKAYGEQIDKYKQKLSDLYGKRGQGQTAVSAGTGAPGVLVGDTAADTERQIKQYETLLKTSRDNLNKVKKKYTDDETAEERAANKLAFAKRLQAIKGAVTDFKDKFLEGAATVYGEIGEQLKKDNDDAMKIITGSDPQAAYYEKLREINRLHDSGNLNDEQFNTAKQDAFNDSFKTSIDQWKEFYKEQKKLHDEARSPFQKYTDELKDLDKQLLLNKLSFGKFGLSGDEVANMKAKAEGDYQGTYKQPSVNVVSEGFFAPSGPAKDVVSEQKKSNDFLKSIEDGIASIVKNPVALLTTIASL